MAELKDMGYKMKEPTAMPSAGKEDKMQYPSIHFDKNIPEEIMSKDVGHMCRLEVVAKVVSKSENDNGNSVVLEIHKLGYLAKAGRKSFEEYGKLSDEDKVKYDKEDMESEPEKEEEQE